jgi:lysophospholipase L1-like esterase
MMLIARFRPIAASLILCALAFVTTAGCAQARPATRPFGAASATTRPHNFARWEKAIAAYEQKDRTNPPARGGILFIGSSTIARWKSVGEDFPGRNVINRGFGGSEIVDSTHFADRIIFPYEPMAIFIKAGSNDLHGGKSADQVFADFKDFVETVHAKLPQTRIYFISMSPTISRWDQHETELKINAMVRAYASQSPNVQYVETYDMVLGPDGRPREELFVADKLHFNAEGYKLLTQRVRPFLEQ